MREIADRLRLPNEHKVRKLSPLPQWLTEVVDKAAAASKPWFHVYLDNFCAMEKGPVGFDPCAGNAVHKALREGLGAVWSCVVGYETSSRCFNSACVGSLF